MLKILASFCLFVFVVNLLPGQEFKVNYDEAKVPEYTLPDPLIFEDGKRVRDKNDWELRRTELINLFEKHVYGKSPSWNGEIIPAEISSNSQALSGSAVMREVKLNFKNGIKEHSVKILLYLPKSSNKSPVFLCYNFEGNHTVSTDSGITPADKWSRDGTGPVKGKESERGSLSRRWPLENIISRGYGVATIYYCDVDPDFDDNFTNGVHALYDEKPGMDSWGSIAAWAWGLSRAMDYLVTLPQVDAEKVIVLGHSRLGKAALWAGACDRRFSVVISNNSGCGGAALSKRVYGETVGSINRAFPHWFCENFNNYNEKESLLPVDQHELLALIAPRPLYVTSADDDQWADPRGEFLSCKEATKVYNLLGKEGLPDIGMPPANTHVSGTIGYHMRKGEHDLLLYDWLQFLDFADKHLKQQP